MERDNGELVRSDQIILKRARIQELRSRLATEAVKWADAHELEHSKDERIPKRESNFQQRVDQNNALQEIVRLTAELHKTERE